jgi:2-oxoglutarate ferredoxin oxidoreductase subunit alpha
MEEKKFLTGNEAALMGLLDAGAEMMFGYPITPASEILQGWVSVAESEKERKLDYLQTEDEIAAGFGVVGAVLAGKKAFTASAGPGHVLLQDPMAMAENLRLPFVGIMMMRGGPSTGTVNFSQQEVNLAAFGGNGDGLRIVYSASSVAEMYELSQKIFSTAWKYRFPTILLGDGYLGKMKSTVHFKKQLQGVKAEPILAEKAEPTHLRNCYSSEVSFGEVLHENIADWKKMAKEVAEAESYHTEDARTLIIAHGIVASACKDAVMELERTMKIGIFRPITVHPIDVTALKRAVNGVKRIFIFESSLNQFSRIIKYHLSGEKVDIVEVSKPAEGFTADEIISVIRRHHE